MSIRKPYNDKAGYIASLRAGANRGWIVIYDAAQAGLDALAGRYAVSCETHNVLVNVSSLARARSAMKYPDFCEECSSTGICLECKRVYPLNTIGLNCADCLMARQIISEIVKCA